MIIWFASGNTHKKTELKEILSSTLPPAMSWDLHTPSDMEIDFSPEETGSTFLQNSLIKAAALYRLLAEKGILRAGDSIIADDSGICVDALNGRPGIYSARYCGAQNESCANLSDAERNTILLAELNAVQNNPVRTGRYICAMVLYYNANRFFSAQETLEGELVRTELEAAGKKGFGYDPIFYIPELCRTAAELSTEEKNRISHRGKAGKAIAQFLSTQICNKAHV